MRLVRENVKEDDWEYFNSLNIHFQGKHITADKYSKWVVDNERKIVFTMVQTPGRDYGATYILLWEKIRVYIYVEDWSELPSDDGIRKYHWDIQSVSAPMTLNKKKSELINLIREIASINCVLNSSSIFVIDNIAEPQFKEVM